MEYIVLIIVGLAAGILGGLLGIGGGVLMIPALVWLFGARNADGMEMIFQYQATSMIVTALLSFFSAKHHLKAGAIYSSVWKTLLPLTALGVVAGVLLTRLPFFHGDGARFLRYGFAGMIICVMIMTIMKLIKPPSQDGLEEHQVKSLPKWRIVTVAGLFGLNTGVFGVGGGAVAVPLMHSVLKMPLRNSIATSSAIIALSSVLGAVLMNSTLGANGSFIVSLKYAAALGPTACIGGVIGSALTHRMPLVFLRIAFIGIMIVVSWKMIAG